MEIHDKILRISWANLEVSQRLRRRVGYNEKAVFVLLFELHFTLLLKFCLHSTSEF